ncbi:MAG: hypothetical protein F7C35_03725 [Desulfurococcales archaeon]|nr:hypothetical protein [Desulfurococcales archaeon]
MARVDRETLFRTLCALFSICRSPHCRVPREAITRAFPSHERGEALKALKELQRQGLIYKAGGKGAYGLTREGIRRALQECTDG